MKSENKLKRLNHVPSIVLLIHSRYEYDVKLHKEKKQKKKKNMSRTGSTNNI